MLNDRHLKRILIRYFDYYHPRARTCHWKWIVLSRDQRSHLLLERSCSFQRSVVYIIIRKVSGVIIMRGDMSFREPQLNLSQHMHRCEQSHGIVAEGFKNLVVVVKTERFIVQNI